jgi:hypothetical protein
MRDLREEKYKLAAMYSVKMVVEHFAANHGWDINTALEELMKLPVYDVLSDPKTGLWTSNPVDVAAIADYQLRGEPVPMEYYFG